MFPDALPGFGSQKPPNLTLTLFAVQPQSDVFKNWAVRSHLRVFKLDFQKPKKVIQIFYYLFIFLPALRGSTLCMSYQSSGCSEENNNTKQKLDAIETRGNEKVEWAETSARTRNLLPKLGNTCSMCSATLSRAGHAITFNVRRCPRLPYLIISSTDAVPAT